MTEHRPDPDTLLARVKEEESRQRRGTLKVFLGAAAGVGKTYAMLQAAHERRAEGLDVLVGWVDTHGRFETEALLHGLTVLPRRQISYHNTTLQEFDLDAALARHPALILVDELAHTNAAGSRHPKRWQDVLELLDSGINVYTAVNIQHLESLNDVVAKITGVQVRETVPDSVLEQADEIELIDLPPDELLQRLKDGKVYVPEQAKEAVQSFFRKGNLIALRELALRRTADRVDAQMRHYMRDHAIPTTWPVAERLMACVSPSPHSVGVVRAAKRFADTLRAEWIVAYVETPADARRSEADRARVGEMLRLAAQLGAETITLSGQRISEEILTYARERNVSKIVLGKPVQPLWKRILFGSIADALVQGSTETDIYIISKQAPPHLPFVASARRRRTEWPAYVRAVLAVGFCTGLAWVMFPHFESANIIMLYLLGVVGVSATSGRRPSVLASVLSVAAFDFFFVPPYFTFAVSDTQYFLTFGVMLVVALVISGLTVRIRWLAESARQRERRTAAVYAMSRELASVRGLDNILGAAARHIAEVFRSQVVFLLPDATGRLAPRKGLPRSFEIDTSEFAVGQWVYEHRQIAGLGTATLPGARALHLPLTAPRGILGVLAVRPTEPHAFETPEQLHQLETFVNQTALALERAQLAEEAQRAQVRAETEQLRNSLLSSVSHDLRTPLASITGTISSLLEDEAQVDPTIRRELLHSVYEEVERLNRLVNNLLDMMRLEAGAVTVRKEWHVLEEVVGTALAHMEKRLHDRVVEIHLSPDLPLVHLDAVLIEQVLVNLLDNAVKYTPTENPIDISASQENGTVRVDVADRGPGFPPGDEERVFEKFYRGHTGSIRGVGLGLTICRAIVEAHGGKIWAEGRQGGGALVRFTLPARELPPEVGEDA
jgi:two-component system, OmpR family, sensor histidine kinase KdpD